ncbi:MAG: hypothetical protein DRI36_00425 [Caldiserica bacterium]|nr:MAG: hypothetical protein DRI36_00425 [Caldisericota bacterium]
MGKYIEEAKKRFYEIVKERNLLNRKVVIKSRVLTPQEAIGNPDRRDFPLLKGKERIMEAKFKDSVGHVFTDMPGNYEDSLKNILNKELKNNFHRAVLIASMNAVLKSLGLIEGVRHCKDNEPEECAKKVSEYLKKNFRRKKRVALIGYQPAFVDELSKSFTLNVLDLNKENFGERYGVPVLDGERFLRDILSWAEIVLCTGTVFVNNTIEEIAELKPIKEIVFYGVTISGIARLLNLKRVCFYSK